MTWNDTSDLLHYLCKCVPRFCSQLFDSFLSVCIFSGDDVLVGHKAVLQADHNPTNTLYDAKRFIGQQFTNDELNSEVSHYPFKVDIFAFICEVTASVLIDVHIGNKLWSYGRTYRTMEDRFVCLDLWIDVALFRSSSRTE